MLARFPRIFILLVGLAVSACVTAPPGRVPLADNARENIASTEVVATIRQAEIYVDVPQSNEVSVAAGGGLLPALVDAGIDSVRTSRAETAVKPLRDAVVDFNFDETFRNDLKTSLSQVAWMHLDGARVVKDVKSQALDEAIGGSRDSAVLLASAEYYLSNDGADLYVVVDANMFANSGARAPMKPKDGKPDVRSDPANALYHNSFMFDGRAPGATDKREDNLAAWSANHGAALRAALTLGAAKLAQMMATDVQNRDTATGVSTDADGSVTRNSNGTLLYVATFATHP